MKISAGAFLSVFLFLGLSLSAHADSRCPPGQYIPANAPNMGCIPIEVIVLPGGLTIVHQATTLLAAKVWDGIPEYGPRRPSEPRSRPGVDWEGGPGGREHEVDRGPERTDVDERGPDDRRDPGYMRWIVPALPFALQTFISMCGSRENPLPNPVPKPLDRPVPIVAPVGPDGVVYNPVSRLLEYLPSPDIKKTSGVAFVATLAVASAAAMVTKNGQAFQAVRMGAAPAPMFPKMIRPLAMPPSLRTSLESTFAHYRMGEVDTWWVKASNEIHRMLDDSPEAFFQDYQSTWLAYNQAQERSLPIQQIHLAGLFMGHEALRAKQLEGKKLWDSKYLPWTGVARAILTPSPNVSEEVRDQIDQIGEDRFEETMMLAGIFRLPESPEYSRR